MKLNKRILITFILIIEAFTLGIIIPSTLSYYRLVRHDFKATADMQAALLAIDVSGCEELNLMNAVPGDEISCTLKVTNTTSKTIKYNYTLDNNTNNFERPNDLVYTVTKNGELKKNEAYPTEEKAIISYDNCLGPRSTDTYTITLKYRHVSADQSADRDKSVKANIGPRDIKFVDECTRDYFKLTINPAGGSYDGSNETIVNYYYKNTTVNLLTPEPKAPKYTFMGWSSSNDKTYSTEVLMDEDITITAIWQETTDSGGDIDIPEDAVCYVVHDDLDPVFYETIQLCNDHALSDDKIVMVKNTEESPTMNRKETLDLNGYTITGKITNVDDLTIVGDGTVTSEDIAINNQGTITLGENDGIVSIEYPHIEGDINGVTTSDAFKFFDGILVGNKAFRGLVTEQPEDYYVYVNYIESEDIQEAWLVPKEHSNTTRGICRIKDVIYMNFQNAIDSDDKDTIYFIRDVELAYDIHFSETENRLVDLDGYTVTSGYRFTNDGILRMTNQKNPTGEWGLSVPITNNNKLTLENINMYQTTNEYAVINDGNLNLINSNLSAPDVAAINQLSGNINVDKDSEIKISNENLYYEQNTLYAITCNGGNISGSGSIQGLTVPQGKECTVNGPEFVTTLYDNTGIFVAGTLTFENGSLKEDLGNIRWNDYLISISTKGTLTINNIDYHTTDMISQYIIHNEGNLVVNGGNIEANMPFLYNYQDLIRTGFTGYKVGFATINNINYTGPKFLLAGANVSGPLGVTINDAKVTCTGDSCIVLGDDQLTINGGDFTCNKKCVSTGTELWTYSKLAKVKITGGTLHALNDNAIHLFSNIITGGTIISDNGYGIYDYNTSSAIGTSIGTQDGDPNPNSLKIIGSTYGVYTSGGYVEIFDGTLYGGVAGINNEPDLTETGYVLNSDEATYNGTKYNTKYLDVNTPFLTVDGVGYTNFPDAINAATHSTNKTITLARNNHYTDAINFTETDLIFDLNGKRLSTTQTLTIASGVNLTINDSSGNNTGKLTSNAINTIKSNGSLTINGGEFNNTYPDNTTGTINGTNVTINGGIFDGSSKVKSNSCAILTITGYSTINNGIFKNVPDACGIIITGQEGNIIGGTFHSSIISSALVTNISHIEMINEGTEASDGITANREVNISDSNIHVKGVAITAPGTVYLTNNTITSDENYAYVVRGKLTQYSGTTKANNSDAIYFYYYSYLSTAYSAELSILGGEIESVTGSVMDIQGLPTKVKVQIGADNSTITKNPVLIGHDYVFNNDKRYNNDGSLARVYIYDGLFKSQNDIDAKNFYHGIKAGYIFDDATEVIDGVTYNTRTLKQAENLVSVNGIPYKTLNEAVSSIPANNTVTEMTLLRDAEITEVINQLPGQKIKFNLDGHLFSTTGLWDIKDDIEFTNTSSNEATLKLIRVENYVINDNNITLKFSNINMTSENVDFEQNPVSISDGTAHIRDRKNNKVIFEHVNFNNLVEETTKYNEQYYADIYIGSGTLEINNSTFETCKGIKINPNGSLKIAESSLISSGKPSYGTAIMTSNNTTLDIYKSELSNTGTEIRPIIYNTGNAVIKESSITGAASIRNSSVSDTGNLTIIDSTVDVSGNSEDYNYNEFIYNYGIVTIERSDINANNLTGIKSYSGYIVNFKSGSISSDEYAIYNYYSTLNIGDSSDSVNPDSPVIKGGQIGIYNQKSATVNFYDGKVKGKAKPIEGDYDSLYTGMMLASDEETMMENGEEVTYQVDYLEPVKYFVSNGTTPYNSLALAISEASSGDTLTFTDNVTISDTVTIPDSMTLTINFNGKKVNFSHTLTNNGTLYLNDATNNGKVSFKLANANIPFIDNAGTLYVNGGNYSSPYFIHSTGDYIELKGVNYTNLYSNINSIFVEKGTFKIEDSTLASITPDGITNANSAILRVSTNNGSKLSEHNQIINSELSITATDKTKDDRTTKSTSLNYISNEDLDIIKSHLDGGVSFSDSAKTVTATESTFDLSETGEAVSVSANVNLVANDLTIISQSYFNYWGSYKTYGYFDCLIIKGKLSGSKLTINIDSKGFSHQPYRGLLFQGTGNADINEVNILMPDGVSLRNYLYGVYYESSAVSSINTLNIDFVNDNPYNNGNIPKVYGIYTNSTGTLDITNANIKIDGNEQSYLYNTSYGIYNEGDINLVIENVDINIYHTNNGYVYGIYNYGIGDITVLSGKIDVYAYKLTAYGIYTNKANGSVTIGTSGDGYDPDRIIVKARSTNSFGVGVQKYNGYFKFYDGTIMGTTNAKPDTTSLVEPDYETMFYREGDFEYCVLTYLYD